MSATAGASSWGHQRAEPVREKGDPERRGRMRVVLAMLGFGVLYSVLAIRLVLLGVGAGGETDDGPNPVQTASQARPDIVDRNGETLATDIRTAALFAEPRYVIDPDEATELIASVLPDIDRTRLRHELSTNAKFTYIRREITPRQQQAIHKLGIPGIGFRVENRRFYPGGAAASHVLGAVNIDNQGISGIEKYIDEAFLNDLHAAGFGAGSNLQPVKLSLDLRVQHVVRDELVQAMGRYNSIAAIGIVLDVNTGEVLGMSSIPDYDANNRDEALDKNKMNRATVGVFEMGSTFKGFTAAMALDSGAVKITDSFDATHGLTVGGFTIDDFHGKHRWLTVPEIFIYSSNVGAARMALATGLEGQDRLSEALRAARRAPHRAAGGGRPDRPKNALANRHTGHHGFRTRHLRLPDADGGSWRGSRQRRLLHHADLHATLGRGGGADCAPDPETGDERPPAPAFPSERAERLRQAGGRSRLQRRRQDRHGGEGRERALFEQQAAQRVSRRVPDGRAEIPGSRRARRAEGREAWHGRHRRIERRADRRQHHPADRADARHRAEGS